MPTIPLYIDFYYSIIDIVQESSLDMAAETNKILVAKNCNLNEQLFAYQKKYIKLLAAHHGQTNKLNEMQQMCNQKEKELNEMQNVNYSSDLINFSDTQINADAKSYRNGLDEIEHWFDIHNLASGTKTDIVSGTIQFTADVRDLF